MAFYRKGEEKELLILANYQKEKRTIVVKDHVKKVVVNNDSSKKSGDSFLKELADGTQIQLGGYQFLVLETK